jgi:hypothetical protein
MGPVRWVSSGVGSSVGVLVGVKVNVGDGVTVGSTVKPEVGVPVGNINSAPSHDERRNKNKRKIVGSAREFLMIGLFL